MTETTTQWIARVLDLLPFEPPTPKRGPQYGTSDTCWLCGGDTGGVGWPEKAATGAGFTLHNISSAMDSDAWCQSCAAVTQSSVWKGLVERRSLGYKIWNQAGWHCYSHLVRECGHYSAPTPREMRGVLMDPPSGGWVLGINTTGKKHTLFRATVARSREHYPVQIDEYTVWIRRSEFRECLEAFEDLCRLGFSKDSIFTGQYHPAQTLKVGLQAWRAAEGRIAPWRIRDPDMLSVVHIVALGPSHWAEGKKEEKEPDLFSLPG